MSTHGPDTRPVVFREAMNRSRNSMPLTDEEKLAQRELDKEIVKEALTEYLDSKFADVGKWSLGGILTAALALLTYWLLISNGWKAP